MGIRDLKRTWFLTYPQNENTMAYLLSKLEQIDTIEEYVIACEPHKDGNPHLHAYVKFESGLQLKDAPERFNVIEKSGNYQPTRSPKAVIKYCTKGDNYISSFDISDYLNKKGKLTVSTIRSKSVKRALEDSDISMHQIRHYTLARSILCEPYEHSDVRGIWIYGPPGTGKSLKARTYPDLYLKSQNKWFDGYAGEKTILIDDFDLNGKFLGHHLKIWADRYACSGEVKGGMVHLQHERLVITSNYHPSAIFRTEKHDEPQDVLIAAIERRFEFIHMDNMLSNDEMLALIHPDSESEN